MVEGPVRQPLAARSKALVIDVARQRLGGRQSDFVVQAAIDLAVSTGDPALVASVRVLATREDAIEQFGISGRRIRIVQQRAVAALARIGAR